MPTPPAAPPVPADPGRRWLLAAVLAAGTVFRLLQYLDRRSLWIDEARLGLNIAGRSFTGLLRPLSYDQAAPVPFLWAERLAVLLGGVNELALRLLPFAAACALPFLMWRLARRLLPAGEALLATSLVALSPMMIRYANEAKPYSVDAAIAALLLLAALRWADDPGAGRSWWVLFLGGLAAVLASFPSIMVLAGIGPGLLLLPRVRRSRPAVLRLLLGGVVWVASFGALYLLVYRRSAVDGFLRAFWESAFLRPGAPDLALRFWHATVGVMSGLLVGTLDSGRWGSLVMSGVAAQALIACLLCLVGLAAVSRRREPGVAVMLAGPLVAAALASSVRAYPLTVRLLLFATPMIFLLLAAGVFGPAGRTAGTRRTMIALAGILLLLAPAVARDVLVSIRPIRQQDTRPVIAEFERRATGTAPVYIYAPAVPAWAFYTTDWSSPDTGRLRWLAEQSSSTGPAFPSRESRNGPVGREGDNLTDRYRGRLELIGIPTGRPLRWERPGPAAPDEGWAENEARRIRAAAESDAWVFFMPIAPDDRQPNLSELQTALARLGGQVVFEFHAREADLFHYHFPQAPVGPAPKDGATLPGEE